MYTEKDLKGDIYNISTTYYVKRNLLEDYISKKIDSKSLIQELENAEYPKDIESIMGRLREILGKIELNGGILSKDPTSKVFQLKKEGKTQEAYDLILPFVKGRPEDTKAHITFGWIVYDLLKRNEDDINSFSDNLEVLAGVGGIDYSSSDKDIQLLKNQILKLISKVSSKGEVNANNIVNPLVQLFKDTDSLFNPPAFIKEFGNPGSTLTKNLFQKLNLENQIKIIEQYEFKWLTPVDYESHSFENQDGRTIEPPSLAEKQLRDHAKKLLELDNIRQEHLNKFILILEREIKKLPDSEWLLYDKIKLLVQNNQNEEALSDLIPFARKKDNQFWVWDLISKLTTEEKEIIICQSKALLCKTKAEMIGSLQLRTIPNLIKLGLYSNGKYEIDRYIETRKRNNWKIDPRVTDWQEEEWYQNAPVIKNRDNLVKYAKKTDLIFYKDRPNLQIFITSIQEDKGTANFLFMSNNISPYRFKNVRETVYGGYFYLNDFDGDFELKIHEMYDAIIVITNFQKPKFHRIFNVKPGNSKLKSDFMKSDTGIVEKISTNPFAFVDDMFIPPYLVEEGNISDGDSVNYTAILSFNRKKNKYDWIVKEISKISN